MTTDTRYLPETVTDASAGSSVLWAWVAAGSLAVAGALHVAAAVDHLGAGDLVVGFFLLVAFLQLAGGVWLTVGAVTRTGSAPWTVAAVLALTVGLLLLYVTAHTTDLLAGVGVGGTDHGGATGGTHAGTPAQTPAPAGPAALGLETARAPATPGTLGTATVAVELVSVLALVALLPAVLRRRATDGLLVLGVLAWGVWFTGVLA